jgi:hypothetical protein
MTVYYETQKIGKLNSKYIKQLTDDNLLATRTLDEKKKEIKDLNVDLPSSKKNLVNFKKASEKANSDRLAKWNAVVALEQAGQKNTPAYTTALAAANAANVTYSQSLDSVKYLENQVKNQQTMLANDNVYVDAIAKIFGTTSAALLKETQASSASGGSSAAKDAQVYQGKRTFKWKYNAPMVTYAYWNSSDGNTLATNFTFGGRYPEKTTDALKDSFLTGGSKGIIQMDAESVFKMQHEKPNPKGAKKDNTAYGFRFHYNPTTLNMTYSMINSVSPEEIASGRDQINPIIPLAQGGFSVDIWLNRIEDLSFLDSQGFMPNDNGLTVSELGSGLYSEDVSTEDLKAIYEKGTMYDLEYLFRACGTGIADYNSVLRGKTSDRGWLTGAAVECHFGSNLRYKGRLMSLNVDHIFFDERMVPTLTKVSLQFARYYDSPITAATKKK